MLFDRLLVRQQPIQRPVQSLVVDALGGNREHILQRRRAVPLLGHVQFARGFAQPRNHQNGCHISPGDALPARRQQLFAQRIELQCLPQQPPQPHRTEAARALKAHLAQIDRNGVARFISVKQMPLRANDRVASDAARQRLSTCPATGIEFAKLRHRLLHHLAAVAHGTNQLPVHMCLAVLLASGMAQVHALAFSRPRTSIATRRSPLHPLLPLEEGKFHHGKNPPMPPSLGKRAVATTLQLAAAGENQRQLWKLG